MKNKATHSGHCQACGHLQKLPSGKLSKHGYTVTHGYFSGVCVGAHELPFEQSCELVKQFIMSAKAQLANVEATQKKLRVAVDGPVAWFLTYQANPRGHWYSQNQVWKRCTVRSETVTYHDNSGTYERFYRNGDTKWTRGAGAAIVAVDEQVSQYSTTTIAEICTKANRSYADWLEHEAKSLRRYIAWQTDRVKNWTSAPLLPVATKDKSGFKPDEPAYAISATVEN